MAFPFSWFGGRKSRSARSSVRQPTFRAASTALAFDQLEERKMLTVTANFAAGALSISSDGADNIAITVVSGNVKINGDDPLVGGNPTATAASAVTSITFAGFTGNNDNEIDLNGVAPAAFTALDSLSVDAGAQGAAGDTIILGGPLTTIGTQTYFDRVRLNGTTALTGTAITFNDTVNSDPTPRGLTINATTTTFNGVVGGSSMILSLTTNAAGTTIINSGAITVLNALTFNDDVTLGANTTVAANDVSFAKTIDSVTAARSLAINAIGVTTLSGNVGAGNALKLASLTTNAGGSTVLGGQSILTTGDQTFNDAVTLVNANPLTLNGTNVTFNSTLNSDATPRQLTVTTTGESVFNGIVGGVNPLATLATTSTGTTKLNGGTLTATTTLSFGQAVILGANTTVAAQNIVFASTLNSDALATLRSLNANGSVLESFQGAVGTVFQLASLTTNAGGVAVISTGAVSVDGDITFNDNVEIHIDVEIVAANVTFNGTLDSDSTPRELDITADGEVAFNGAVGATETLKNLDVSAGDLITLGASVTTDEEQIYDGPVEVVADITLTGNEVQFNETLDSDTTPRDLTINVSGETRFLGVVGGLHAFDVLTTDAAGTTLILGGAVSAATQAYNDPVILGEATTLTGTAVTFGSTLNSGDADNVALTVNASGQTRFVGNVGGTKALRSLQTNAAGTTLIEAASIVTLENQTYLDAVTLASNLTVTGVNVTFDSTLNSDAQARTLSINDTGTTTFGGVVGGVNPLASLTTNAAGITAFETTAVTTTGDQTYNDAVQLLANVTFFGAGITFNSTVDSAGAARALAVNATGVTTFAAAVGGNSALSSITTDEPGLTRINSSIITVSPAASTKVFADDVEIGANWSFNGGSATFLRHIEAPAPDGTDLTWLKNLYFEALRRPIDGFGLQNWMDLMDGGISRVDIAQGVLGSVEYRTNLLDAWYEQYLGRALDPLGQSTWLQQFQDGVTPEGVLRQILASDEYFNAAGGTLPLLADALAADLWESAITPAEIAGLDRQEIVDFVAGDNRYTAHLINGSSAGVNPTELVIGNWYGRIFDAEATQPQLDLFDAAILQLFTGIRWNDAFSFILASDQNFT